MNVVPLKNVTNTRDLGVIFNSNRIFDMYIESVVKSASEILDYVTRKSKMFRKIRAVTCLFTSFVLGKLDFVNIVRNSRKTMFISRIENIQYRLVKYL